MNYVAMGFAIGLGIWLIIIFIGIIRMRRDGEIPSLFNRIEENEYIIGRAYLSIYKDIIDIITQLLDKNSASV